MNQVQRKFLIDKIKEEITKKIKLLESSREESPLLSTHIYREIMQGTLKLKSENEILGIIKERAINAREGSDWLTRSRSGWGSEKGRVALDADEIFILPNSFVEKRNQVDLHNAEIQKTINKMRAELNTLEMRIQLASDKTLQKMIGEVDDMGDISLIDTKIKQIGNS